MTPKPTNALLILALASIVLAVFVGITYAISLAGDVARDAYASDWTTEFLISHLQSNNNSWPSSWGELEDEHATLYPQTCPFTLTEIRDRVELRFDLDSTAVANAKDPIVFFRLKSGSGANYGGDPNVRIRDYLANQVSTIDANNQ